MFNMNDILNIENPNSMIRLAVGEVYEERNDNLCDVTIAEPDRNIDTEVYTNTPKKIRPEASVRWSDGIDSRDGYYYINYRCPNCDRNISEGLVACDRCGTFFDWSKKAKIKIERSIIWY